MKYQKQVAKKQVRDEKTVSTPTAKTKIKPRQKITEKVENLLNHKIVLGILLVVVSVVFYYNYSATFDEKINLGGDNIYYYSTGKALAEGKGYTNTMLLEETPHTHFPPGYPSFIALLMKCGIGSIHNIKVANGILLYASLILLFFILAYFAKNRLVAFLAVLFTALHTQLLGFACIMMSEMLFILFSCIVLLIILYFPPDKLFVDKGKRLRDILILCALALCLSYIYFIRVMGMTIILAVISYFAILMVQKLIILVKNRKEQELLKQNKLSFFKYGLVFLITIVSFLAPKMAWDIRNDMIGKEKDPYASTYLGKKEGGKMETMEDWKVRLINNGSNYIGKYIPSSVLQYKVKADYYPVESGDYPSTKEWILGISFLILLLFSVVKSQNGLILFLYVGITLLVLLGWQEQYGGYRYMIPIIPFLVFLFFNGIANIIALVCRFFPKKPKPLIPQIIVLSVCTIMLYPTYIKAQSDLRATAKIKTWKAVKEPKMSGYIEACEFCKDNLPDSIRVIARKPELFYMFSGYKKSSSFPWYGEPDTIMSFLRKQKATHIIIDSWYRHAYTTLYPAVRAYPEKFKVLKEIGKVDTVNQTNPTYVLEFNNEWGYHGAYKDGNKDGEGYELYQDGRKYVGHFENNQPNGNGILYGKDGNIIAKGLWRDGSIFKGEGDLHFSDGRKYTGQYEANSPDGNGTLYDKDGNIVFKGYWRKGAFLKGEGTLSYQNGNRYKGQVENGVPNGYGTFFDSTGKVISKGQWRNGVFVGENN